jgi:hypothetical protein
VAPSEVKAWEHRSLGSIQPAYLTVVGWGLKDGSVRGDVYVIRGVVELGGPTLLAYGYVWFRREPAV